MIQGRPSRWFGRVRRTLVKGLRTKLISMGLATVSFLTFAQGRSIDQAPQSKPVTDQGSSSADKSPKKAAPEGTTEHGKSVFYDPTQYVIGADDELMISVWREPELSLGVVVRPDGMITLPLLNDVPVMGLTTTQLGDALTEKLKPFVNEPQVTVIVRNIHSRRAYLVGEVSRQGAYSLNGRLTIMELLAEAGGMGPFAKTDKIYVLRKVNGKPVQIPFNYKKSIVGRGDKENIVLLPGDIVVFP